MWSSFKEWFGVGFGLICASVLAWLVVGIASVAFVHYLGPWFLSLVSQ